MKKEDILSVLNTKDFSIIKELSNAYSKDTYTALRQYDPYCHDVKDATIRKDRWVNVPLMPITIDPNTQKPRLQSIPESVTRSILAIQQDIVQSAAGILCSNPIQLNSDADVSKLQKVWDDNKLSFKTTSICEVMMSETEVAELWYRKENKYKMMVLKPSNCDKIFPVFDDYGDMIAFGRSYKTDTYLSNSIVKDVSNYEIYTDTQVFIFNDNEQQINVSYHGFKKIPVIYYAQENTEWHVVQPLIDQLEKILSNLGDTNIRFSNPVTVAKGKIDIMPNATEQAKLLQVDVDGDIKYLTWNNAPESVKLEFNTLMSMVYNLTHTVNTSSESFKGVFGSAPSEYVIKIIYTPAHMKASKHEENFGQGIQRRINLMKSFLGISEDVLITPKFTYYIPRNDKEQIDALAVAKDKGLNSDETLIRLSPFTADPQKEVKAVEKANTAALVPVAPTMPVVPVNKNNLSVVAK